MIDCFVTHVWRESPQWVEFEKFLYNDKKIKWRNFSLPWHDPALKLGEGLGKELLLKDLTNQIKPTKLYPLNRSVDSVNNRKLEKLINKNGTQYEYNIDFVNNTRRKLDKDSMSKYCLAPETLILTENCQVMLIYNLDHDLGLVNGSRGVVTRFEDDLPVVKFMNGVEKTIDFNTWEITEKDKVIATLSQIPLRLGYAFSIHKSQGCTLDYAIIDLSNIFEYGMGYVALSRVKSLDGLSIKKINWDQIVCHPKAVEFYKKIKNKKNNT